MGADAARRTRIFGRQILKLFKFHGGYATQWVRFSRCLYRAIERKYFIAVSAVCIAIFVTLYGLTSNPAFIVVFGAASVMWLQASTVGIWTYQSECFPTEVRSGATGFVYGVGRMANIVGPFIVSGLYGTFGYYSVFAYLAGATCSAARSSRYSVPKLPAVNWNRLGRTVSRCLAGPRSPTLSRRLKRKGPETS